MPPKQPPKPAADTTAVADDDSAPDSKSASPDSLGLASDFAALSINSPSAPGSTPQPIGGRIASQPSASPLSLGGDQVQECLDYLAANDTSLNAHAGVTDIWAKFCSKHSFMDLWLAFVDDTYMDDERPEETKNVLADFGRYLHERQRDDPGFLKVLQLVRIFARTRIVNPRKQVTLTSAAPSTTLPDAGEGDPRSTTAALNTGDGGPHLSSAALRGVVQSRRITMTGIDPSSTELASSRMVGSDDARVAPASSRFSHPADVHPAVTPVNPHHLHPRDQHMHTNSPLRPSSNLVSPPSLRVHTSDLTARLSPTGTLSPLSSIAADASSSSAFMLATRVMDAMALSNLTGFDTVTQRYRKGTRLHEATKIFDRQEYPQVTAAAVLGGVVLERKEVSKVDLSMMRRVPKFAPMEEDPRRFLVRFVQSATELSLARVDSVWARAFYEAMETDESEQLQHHYTFDDLVCEFDRTFRPAHDPEARLRACTIPTLCSIEEYSSKKFAQHASIACRKFTEAVDEHWESERDSKRFSIRAGEMLLGMFPPSVQADLKADIRVGIAGLEGLGRNHSIPVVYVVQAIKHFLPVPEYWVGTVQSASPLPLLSGSSVAPTLAAGFHPTGSTAPIALAAPVAPVAPAASVTRLGQRSSPVVQVSQAEYFEYVEALAIKGNKGCFYCGNKTHRFRECPVMQSDLDEGIVKWGMVGEGNGRPRLMACHGDRQVLMTRDYPMRRVAYAAAKSAGLTPSQTLEVAPVFWESELCMADFEDTVYTSSSADAQGPGQRSRSGTQSRDSHHIGRSAQTHARRRDSRSRSRDRASWSRDPRHPRRRSQSRSHSPDHTSQGRDPRPSRRHSQSWSRSRDHGHQHLQSRGPAQRPQRSRSRSESPAGSFALPIIQFVAEDHEARLTPAQRDQLAQAIAKEAPQVQTLIRNAVSSVSSCASLPACVREANGWVALSQGGRRQQSSEWTWAKKWANGLIVRHEVKRDLDALVAYFAARLKEIAAYNFACQEDAVRTRGKGAVIDASCVEFVSGADDDGVMSMDSRPLKRVRGDDDLNPYQGPAEFVSPPAQQPQQPPAPLAALEPPMIKLPTKRQLMTRAINRVTDEAARMLAAQVLNAPVRGDDGFTFGHLLRFAPIRSAINRQLGLRGGRNPTLAQSVPPPAQPAPMTPPPAPTMAEPPAGAQRTLRELLAEPSPMAKDVDMFVGSLEAGVGLDRLVEGMIRRLEEDPALCVAFAQRVPSCRALVERLLELESEDEGLEEEEDDGPSAFLVAAVERLRYRATTVRLPVTLARSNVPMLLDSGAMVSLLDASVADELGLEVVPSPEGKEHVRVANGAAAELVGVWQGEVTILGETRVAHFYVMHGLTRHALLGMPAIIDFRLAQIPEGESMVVRGRNGEVAFPLVSTMGPALRGIAPELLEVESWNDAGALGSRALQEMVLRDGEYESDF